MQPVKRREAFSFDRGRRAAGNQQQQLSFSPLMLMLLSLSLTIGYEAVTQTIINERLINDGETALTLMSVTSAGNLMKDPNRYWKAVQVRLRCRPDEWRIRRESKISCERRSCMFQEGRA